MMNSTNNQSGMKDCKKITFTDRSVKSVNLYLLDINKYSALSTEEEYDLWECMQKGSRTAREQLIKSNVHFVVTMAKKYTWSGVALEDLISCGNIGLTLAADRFDASRGYRFLSFAVWWIDSELKKAVTENWPYKQMASLDNPINPDEDGNTTLLDLIVNDGVKSPDWDLSIKSEFSAMKESVKNKFFGEAASIFEDAVTAQNIGLSLNDVARKHGVSEKTVKELIKQIRTYLSDEYPIDA